MLWYVFVWTLSAKSVNALVLKILKPWHIWFFTVAAPIRFFQFMFLAMVVMKFDDITKKHRQTKKSLPFNDANISHFVDVFSNLANRNLRFSFLLLHKLKKVAWTPHLSASHLRRKEPQLVSLLLLLCFVELVLVKFYISLGKLREVHPE